MEITLTTRRLIDRAGAQIVRELSRTPIRDLPISAKPNATVWVSVDVRLAPRRGVLYIAAALGLRGDHQTFEAPGLIEAIAKQQPEEAHRIVREIVETAVAQAFEATTWKRAG